MLEWLLRWVSGETGHVYRAVWFEFTAPVPVLAAIVALAAVFCGGIFYWQFRLGALRKPYRWGLSLLRAAALTLVLFLLLGPGLVGRRNQPGQHFVLLLVDDSRSMQVRGADGKTRGERLLAAFSASGIVDRLRASHQVVLFGFGASPDRLQDTGNLGFERRESDLVGAVSGALRKMAGAHVSAVVLFSDGVQQALGQPEGLGALSDGVPVFAVGTGQEGLWRSLELTDLSVGRTPFDRSPVAMTAHVTSEGLAGERVVVEAVAGRRVVAVSSFSVAKNRDENSVRLEFVPQKEGWVWIYRFSCCG